MDLETENRIAAILMKEAAELRCQAEKDGVSVYLHQPKPKKASSSPSQRDSSSQRALSSSSQGTSHVLENGFVSSARIERKSHDSWSYAYSRFLKILVRV